MVGLRSPDSGGVSISGVRSSSSWWVGMWYHSLNRGSLAGNPDSSSSPTDPTPPACYPTQRGQNSLRSKTV
eukprot:963387-Pyramimonas_sp.AAC.1